MLDFSAMDLSGMFDMFKLGNAADGALPAGVQGPVRPDSGILGGINDTFGLNLNDEASDIGSLLDRLFGAPAKGDATSKLDPTSKAAAAFLSPAQQLASLAPKKVPTMNAPAPRPIMMPQPLNFLDGLNLRR